VTPSRPSRSQISILGDRDVGPYRVLIVQFYRAYSGIRSRERIVQMWTIRSGERIPRAYAQWRLKEPNSLPRNTASNNFCRNILARVRKMREICRFRRPIESNKAFSLIQAGAFPLTIALPLDPTGVTSGPRWGHLGRQIQVR